ncbi:MAG: hypothetical protein OXN44_05780 [Acidimicrobiaceae bacterium]|nr:hypothetical protein [Acidimicrobiaceae bacterium]
MIDATRVAQQIADGLVKRLAITRTGVLVVAVENASVDGQVSGVSVAEKKGRGIDEALVSDLSKRD